jgi:hypothetical protein
VGEKIIERGTGVETHVVTMEVSFCDGQQPVSFTCELFRGDEGECRALCAAVAGCSHDMRPISEVIVQWGALDDWKRYLQLRAARDAL